MSLRSQVVTSFTTAMSAPGLFKGVQVNEVYPNPLVALRHILDNTIYNLLFVRLINVFSIPSLSFMRGCHFSICLASSIFAMNLLTSPFLGFSIMTFIFVLVIFFINSTSSINEVPWPEPILTVKFSSFY